MKKHCNRKRKTEEWPCVYLKKQHPVLHLLYEVDKTYLHVRFFFHLNPFVCVLACIRAIIHLSMPWNFSKYVLLKKEVDWWLYFQLLINSYKIGFWFLNCSPVMWQCHWCHQSSFHSVYPLYKYKVHTISRSWYLGGTHSPPVCLLQQKKMYARTVKLIKFKEISQGSSNNFFFFSLVLYFWNSNSGVLFGNFQRNYRSIHGRLFFIESLHGLLTFWKFSQRCIESPIKHLK